MKTTFSVWLKTKRGKQVTWAAAAFLVYTLMGFLVVPWIVGKVIPKQASEFLGREVSIESVHLNPFTLSGTFQGLMVKDRDGTTLFSWDEVYGNFQLSSIFHWALTFKEVRADSPYAHVQINPDYTLNVTDILEALQEQLETVELASLPALRIEFLEITNAVASVSDLTLREPFHREIGPLTVELNNFYTDPTSENPYSFEGTTEVGERFTWSGRFFLFPLRSDGELSVENIQIASYAPFYQDFFSLTVSEGVADFSGSYRIEYGGTNNLFSVSNVAFQLTSLQVSDGKAAGNALEVDDLRVSGVEADLQNRSARIRSMTANGGTLAVQRDGNARINLLEMSKPSEPEAGFPGAMHYALRVVTNLVEVFLYTTNEVVAVIDELEVNDWTLELLDNVNSRTVELRIDNIQVRGKQLSNVPGANLNLNLDCHWNNQGTVKVEIDARLFPIHSDVHIKIDQIELPPLDPYAEPFANILLLDSKFSLDGVMQIRRDAIDAPFDVEFEGDLSLNDFSSEDGRMGSELIEWHSLAMTDVRATLNPMEVSVNEILINDAHLVLGVETNRSINLLNVLNVGDSNASVTVPAISINSKDETIAEVSHQADALTSLLEDLPLATVDRIVISNATVDLLDASTEPPVRWTITELNGSISGLTSTNLQQANLHFDGKAGGAATMVIDGDLHPFSGSETTDLTLKLSSMDMVPFGPYSGRYAGYQLRKGKLSLDLDYHITANQLASENIIVLDQLTFGQSVESPEATKLPVKLGVAILKDRNGVIEMDVPVEGDLDDPDFKLKQVIVGTIMNMLTKTISSPFALLGSLVGGSEEELSMFEFAAGSSELSLSVTNSLSKLAEALYERPGLQVELQGSVEPEQDGLAIRRQKLHRQIQQARWEDLRASAQALTEPEEIEIPPDVRRTYLKSLYSAAFPDQSRTLTPMPGKEGEFYSKMAETLMDGIEVNESDLRRLAHQRLQAVKQYLIQTAQIDSDRLFLAEDTSDLATEGSNVQLQLQ